jgi:poly-gamma-glutamate synthesis protein (capsule biosynthesis protein)
VRDQAVAVAAAHPQQFQWTADPDAADVVLVAGEGAPVATWIYAAAGPFATVEDDLDLADLTASWQGESDTPLVLSATDAAVFTQLWGAPDQESGAVLVVEEPDLADTVWANQPAWTIRPYDALTPDLKVMRLDGASPLDVDFIPAGYPLQVTVGLAGDSAAIAALEPLLPGRFTNRDPDQLTRVAMTGVTALVRATAYQMELNGVLYPGEEVQDLLQAVDIAHISNEVAFTPDCPAPNPVGGTTFCSADRYFALLDALGTDVVELTGNHVNDWGADTFSETLSLYTAAGMSTFGGGRDLAAAERPATLIHHGNRIAFVGCNPVGPSYAWAGPVSAGSQPCDYAALYDQIATLREQGYVVIATQQYLEIYSYAPTNQQAVDFAALAAAGAHAVSGSQGHHAQGFGFVEGAFIHYGLGNLFFDQMDQLGTRQTFIDIYHVYDGRIISVELWTGLIENFARPRPMTAAERAGLLRAAFQGSGW